MCIRDRYNTENDDLLDNMKRIAETVLKYYPDHIESLSNLSIVFMLQKQYDKALEPLLKAEKLNPKDYIVSVSYTHLRAHETVLDLVCRLLLEKKNKKKIKKKTTHKKKKKHAPTNDHRHKNIRTSYNIPIHVERVRLLLQHTCDSPTQ
mgnify:CR=1 FL=1